MVLSALLYQESLLTLWAGLYHPNRIKRCGPFQMKIPLAKGIIKGLQLALLSKLYLMVDSRYWTKALVRVCREWGYHMISQLKSNSVLFVNGKRTNITLLVIFIFL